MPDQPAQDEYSRRRNDMVDRQIAARGVRSKKVVEAMRTVPREEFIPENLREFAYHNSPLPIAAGQTISQPYIVAFMIDALRLEGGERVLEVGAGSGYAAAILSRIASKVYAIERIGVLADNAAATVSRLGYDNVDVRQGDGTQGWPEEAPFDAIVVAAGGTAVPEPLKQQLRIGGRLVIPVGQHVDFQELVCITRTGEDEFEQKDLAAVRFVPLISDEEQASNPVSSVARAEPCGDPGLARHSRESGNPVKKKSGFPLSRE